MTKVPPPRVPRRTSHVLTCTSPEQQGPRRQVDSALLLKRRLAQKPGTFPARAALVRPCLTPAIIGRGLRSRRGYTRSPATNPPSRPAQTLFPTMAVVFISFMSEAREATDTIGAWSSNSSNAVALFSNNSHEKWVTQVVLAGRLPNICTPRRQSCTSYVTSERLHAFNQAAPRLMHINHFSTRLPALRCFSTILLCTPSMLRTRAVG